MGKSQSSAPPPQQPNTSSIINQQTASNVATAIANARLNNTNQVTPYGNLTYEETGGGYDSHGTWVPSFTATQTLSPDQQRLYDTQTRIGQGALDLGESYVGRIRDATATPFSYAGMPAAPNAPQYDADFRKQTFENILARNQPTLDNERRAMAQRLADQGIGIEDPAYRTAMDQFSRGVNDFRLGADLQSQQQATQDYQTAVQGYGVEANQRDRAIQEALNLRNQPINELSALLGLSSGVQNPQFVNTPQYNVAPTDVAGIYANNYAGQLAGYNAQQQQAALQRQQSNAGLGGLAGLVGTVGGAALGSPWVGGLFGLAGKAAG